MADIIDSVGPGGVNAIHDVVLIQLMLKTLKNPHTTAYFSPPYILAYSNDTARAITAFQTDQNLIGGSPDGGRPDGGSVELPGLAKPGGATWQALRSAFVRAAPRYLDARTMRGVGLAYLPMPQGRMSASVGGINAAKNLQSAFRHKVVQLVQNFYQLSSIAWSLIPTTGGWRSFAGQEGLTSDAGYGESIHQFGYAVDVAIPN